MQREAHCCFGYWTKVERGAAGAEAGSAAGAYEGGDFENVHRGEYRVFEGC